MSQQHLTDDRLIAMALGELEGRERAEADAHAASCRACADAAARLTRALEAYRAEPLPDPPARVLMTLLERQAEQREERAARVRGWTWRRATGIVGAAAAVCALGFLGGYAAGSRSGGANAAGGASREAAAETARPGERPERNIEDARRRDSVPVRKLPPAPDVAFQSAPPMDAWLAASPGEAGWFAPRADVKDSL